MSGQGLFAEIAPESPLLLGAGAPTPPTVSVIVPAKAPTAHLGACLWSLVRQDLPHPYEIVVVLGADSAGAGGLQETFPRVRVGLCPPGAGPGGARNRGIDLARGEYLAFTDSDCLPDKDWLRTLLQACRDNDGGPVRGWVGPMRVSSLLARASLLAEHGTPRPKRACPVPSVCGANMCLARRLLHAGDAPFAVGTYGAEDVALLSALPTWRGRAILEPAAQVRHLRDDNLGGSLRRMYLLGCGSGRLRRRLPMRGALLARCPPLVLLLAPARLALTGRRAASCGARALLDFLRLSPLILLHLICYSAGFARGAFGRRGAVGAYGDSHP